MLCFCISLEPFSDLPNNYHKLPDITSKSLTLIGITIKIIKVYFMSNPTNNSTKLKEIRVKMLTMSKASLARDAGIDVKTYSTIEDGIKPGRDVTRESIKNAVNMHLAQKNRKPISVSVLFSSTGAK